jgi:hypothetical protein
VIVTTNSVPAGQLKYTNDNFVSSRQAFKYPSLNVSAPMAGLVNRVLPAFMELLQNSAVNSAGNYINHASAAAGKKVTHLAAAQISEWMFYS